MSSFVGLVCDVEEFVERSVFSVDEFYCRPMNGSVMRIIYKKGWGLQKFCNGSQAVIDASDYPMAGTDHKAATRQV
jgi:hypothetical protein